MNIYFGHSKELDYENFYQKIRESFKNTKYNFIFPHEKSKDSRNGRAFYSKANIDLFIAEVSLPATGLGIELGFSHDEGIPIICFYNSTKTYSNYLKSVTDKFIAYNDINNFITKLQEVLTE